jgi:hypothetical protein
MKTLFACLLLISNIAHAQSWCGQGEVNPNLGFTPNGYVDYQCKTDPGPPPTEGVLKNDSLCAVGGVTCNWNWAAQTACYQDNFGKLFCSGPNEPAGSNSAYAPMHTRENVWNYLKCSAEDPRYMIPNDATCS